MRTGTVFIFILLLVLIGVIFYVGASNDLITFARTSVNAVSSLTGNALPTTTFPGVPGYYTGVPANTSVASG